MRVGVRELRDSLSRHLASVQEGATVTVTDHGRPIAQIVPIGTPSKLDQLIAARRVTPAARRKRPARAPRPISGTVSDLIADQRR